MLSRFIGMLAGIGIAKGQPFEPDEHTKAKATFSASTSR